MDPVKLLREDQNELRDQLGSRTVVARLARYLDVEERVLFDFCARYLRDDDQLALAREQQADLERLLSAERSDADELAAAFERHVEHVNTQLLAPLVTRVDATRYEELGDALEEARRSWDEHDQLPHVRVGQVAEQPQHVGASAAPGDFLGDDLLPAAPEPNEPA